MVAHDEVCCHLSKVYEVHDWAADEDCCYFEGSLTGRNGSKDVSVRTELGDSRPGVPMENLQVPSSAAVGRVGGDGIQDVTTGGDCWKRCQQARALNGWGVPSRIDDVVDNVSKTDLQGSLRR